MKSIFKFLSNLVSRGTKESSMRLGFLSFVFGCILILISICFYIIRFALALRDPNWLGIGGLITGIGVAISGFAYMKVQQSKIEENNNNETQENK